ncbi:MAG: methylmalonyl Co-A mutase-associated GTPase MeaB [Bacteroidales bacterium]|nr:methylmalonyl Co-A mutase-associated GTPase MeaB [Bacteroidales bacterium]
MTDKKKDTALNVSVGVAQPSSVNERALEQIRRSRRPPADPDTLFSGIRSGNRTALSQAITLVESALPEHHDTAQALIRKCLPFAGNSLRLGITGVPGAGKSTFIESFGNYLIHSGHKIAVLAIDPSSERSGGSILGDKTRMETLAGADNAFIRPSPSGGTLGGVARKTRESMILCEAAGYDTIIVETVGVGQSETTVHSMVDFFMVLLIPGAGDELQGMKRGIMEMADALLINKSDGENVEPAQRAKTEYTNALHLFPLPPSGWAPQVITCSAIEGTGVEDAWNMVLDYKNHVAENGFFNKRRSEQSSFWMYQTLNEGLKLRFFNNPEVREKLHELEKMMVNDQISSFAAAAELLNRFFPEIPAG